MAELDTQRQLAIITDHLERLRKADAGTPGGSAFPSGPTTGFTFFRTDLGFACYYDGTRWLTINEYTLTLYERTTLAAGVAHDFVVRDNYTPYYTRVLMTTSVVAPNGAGDYWSVFVQGLNLAISATTTILQINTDGDTAGVNTSHSGIVTTALPTNRDYVRLIATVGAGAPGTLTTAVAIVYRLVVT